MCDVIVTSLVLLHAMEILDVRIVNEMSCEEIPYDFTTVRQRLKDKAIGNLLSRRKCRRQRRAFWNSQDFVAEENNLQAFTSRRPKHCRGTLLIVHIPRARVLQAKFYAR